MSSQPKTITVLGSKVRYWEFNPSERQTIVMIHGFRGTHHGLQAIIDVLPELHIVIPDLPGFGESTPMNIAHDIAGYQAFTESFVRIIKAKQPVLLGHSFGSIIASHVAAESPELISSLILINPISTPALQGPKELLTGLALFYYWLGKKLPASAGRALLSNPLIVRIASIAMTKTSDKRLRKYIHTQHRTHFSSFQNRQVLDEAFRASVSHTIRDVAQRITAPTLLIVGDKDDIAPLKGQRELALKLLDGNLTIIQGVGHLVHYETPKAAADAIVKFVKTQNANA